MIEQRKFERSSSAALCEVVHPSFGSLEFKVRDLSDGGAFVYSGHHIAPPVGTVVKVVIKRYSGVINEEPVDMRVVHHQSGGFGMMFI
jgi:hypothetical protein